MLLAMRELRGVRLVRQLIAESTVPAPACCFDIGMAGERSWIGIYSGIAPFTFMAEGATAQARQ
jgi:hypothetical protein